MALLDENDILFAHKALNLIGGLTEATKRVAGAIIDHFNKRTGQCDPSIERLATLLGTDEKTVRRATSILDEKQLIAKTSHGGKAHRASYVPNWGMFRAIVADWDARMKTGRAPSKSEAAVMSKPPETNRTRLPGSTGQDCPVKPGEIALQTLRSNQSKEPIEGKRAEKPPEKPQPIGPTRATNGLPRGSKPTAQRTMLLPIAGSRSPSHADAVRAAAERRWYAEVHGLGVKAETAIIEWMTPERQEAATLAEIQRKGGGLDFIIAERQAEMRRMHG